MAIHKIPSEVQFLLHASSKIRSIVNVIQELVFNSIDAESTSIAIRINLQEKKIQVVDNGIGIVKNDFKLLGTKYASSKIDNISSIKCIPRKFGYKGEALSNIIQVSKEVIITSKHCNTEETYFKEFHKGKERKISTTSMRPSKGTTVEVKGLLYNLHIQRKCMNPIDDLQDIKQFLENISIIYSNLSLSLRDDTKNEIVFKIHKSRDIYQTFSTLFNINKQDIQELEVQKNEYKIRAYIGKKKDLPEYQWIYINGRLLKYCKIHELVQKHLDKIISLQKKITKSKQNDYRTDEHVILDGNSTFYCLILSCPYYDYDISFEPKESIQFKNWKLVETLIEKLIRFFIGDLKVKEVKTKNKISTNFTKNDDNASTRDQVKIIMEKILQSNSKKIGVSQLQNGIKGKLTKRKVRVSKCKVASTVKSVTNGSKQICGSNKNIDSNVITAQLQNNENIPEVPNLSNLRNNEKIKNMNHVNRQKITNKSNLRRVQYAKNKCKKLNKNNICKAVLRKFRKQTDSVQRRCNILKQNVHVALSNAKIGVNQQKNVFVNERIENSNFTDGNKNISIRKRYNEIIIHEPYSQINPGPILPKYTDKKKFTKANENKNPKSNYDLVHTILSSQQKYTSANFSVRNDNRNCFPRNRNTRNSIGENEYFHTYESHNYQNVKTDNDNYKINNNTNMNNNVTKRRNHFITNQSRDNFTNDEFTFTNLKKRVPKNMFQKFNRNLLNLEQSSFTIEFTNTEKTNIMRSPNISKLNCSLKNQNLDFHDEYLVNNEQSNIDFANTNLRFTNLPKKSKSCNDILFIPGSTESLSNEISFTQGVYSQFSVGNYSPVIQNTYTLIPNSTDRLKNEEQYQKSLQLSTETDKVNDSFLNKSLNPVLSNTYTIFCPHNNNLDTVDAIQYSQNEELRSENTYIINTCSHYDKLENNQTPEENIQDESTTCNVEIVFLSKSQDIIRSNSYIDPAAVCETVMTSHSYGAEFENSFHSNATCTMLEHNLDDEIKYNKEHPPNIEVAENFEYDLISHHFDPNINHKKDSNFNHPLENHNHKVQFKINNITANDKCEPDKGQTSIIQANGFGLKNRPRFLPKGLSPIYHNCNNKNICDYNTQRDYYEKDIYADFANHVQVNAGIYEATVQDYKESATKEIVKVNQRLNKENASLLFNGNELKYLKVLGQVDNKFIAAIIRGKNYHTSQNVSEILVLFDQHAVHERVRLENNMKEYLTQEIWKNVMLENSFTLKVTKDEMIFLHNYKEKFEQFGLEWDILENSEILITAIPEAIMGKNARSAEVIRAAVKKLILEQITAIRRQKGNASIYPKAIMNLVFSEACRYAIKFGDSLSKNYCIDLLNNLSECKTPFQCAHGRPVMAVLMDIQTCDNKYKINFDKILGFSKKYQT